MKTNKEIYNEFMTKNYLGVRVTTEDRIIHAMEECTKEKDAEIERLRGENEFKSAQLGEIHDIVDKQNFDTDSREFEIWKIINKPIN